MLRLGLNAGRRRGAVTRGIEPPVRPSQGGLYRERRLTLEPAHGRADREGLWRLIGRHVPEDRAVERAVASLERPSFHTRKRLAVNRPLKSPSWESWLSWQPEMRRTAARTAARGSPLMASWSLSYMMR